jgi:hypothetical protein
MAPQAPAVLLKPPGREGVAAPQVSAAPTRNALAAFHLQRAPIAARAWVTSVLEQVSTAWPRQPAPAIPATRGVRLHDLRHTFAVLQLSAGVHFMQVSKWLGHSTFTLTLDVYGDYIPEQDGGALSTLPEPFSLIARSRLPVLKIRPVSVRVRLGAPGNAGYRLADRDFTSAQ